MFNKFTVLIKDIGHYTVFSFRFNLEIHVAQQFVGDYFILQRVSQVILAVVDGDRHIDGQMSGVEFFSGNPTVFRLVVIGLQTGHVTFFCIYINIYTVDDGRVVRSYVCDKGKVRIAWPIPIGLFLQRRILEIEYRGIVD